MRDLILYKNRSNLNNDLTERRGEGEKRRRGEKGEKVILSGRHFYYLWAIQIKTSWQCYIT